MNEAWIWEFRGFETLQGNRPVQEWYDGLSDEERDEANDTIGYLQNLPNHLWKRPEFDQLEDGISEVRFKYVLEYRIYGYFGPSRRQYSFLHGTDKKVKNDKKGKRTAKDRYAQLGRSEAKTHEFEFKKQPDPPINEGKKD